MTPRLRICVLHDSSRAGQRIISVLKSAHFRLRFASTRQVAFALPRRDKPRNLWTIK
jgi:hypothetical protein